MKHETLILFTCDACGYRARIPRSYGGTAIVCPSCASPQVALARDDGKPRSGDTQVIAQPVQAAAPAAAPAPAPVAEPPAAKPPAQAPPAANDGKISFHCGKCGSKARIPAEYAGRVVRCPTCDAVQIAMPGASPTTGRVVKGVAVQAPRTAALDETGKIIFTCTQCSFSGRLSPSYAGKAIQCPACKQPQVVDLLPSQGQLPSGPTSVAPSPGTPVETVTSIMRREEAQALMAGSAGAGKTPTPVTIPPPSKPVAAKPAPATASTPRPAPPRPQTPSPERPAGGKVVRRGGANNAATASGLHPVAPSAAPAPAAAPAKPAAEAKPAADARPAAEAKPAAEPKPAAKPAPPAPRPADPEDTSVVTVAPGLAAARPSSAAPAAPAGGRGPLLALGIAAVVLALLAGWLWFSSQQAATAAAGQIAEVEDRAAQAERRAQAAEERAGKAEAALAAERTAHEQAVAALRQEIEGANAKAQAAQEQFQKQLDELRAQVAALQADLAAARAGSATAPARPR